MKNKDCAVVRDLLAVYTDGICSEDTKEFVSGHLEECPDCKKILEKAKNISYDKQTNITEKKKIKKAKRKIYERVAFVILLVLALMVAVYPTLVILIAPENFYPHCITKDAQVIDYLYDFSEDEINGAAEALKAELIYYLAYNGAKLISMTTYNPMDLDDEAAYPDDYMVIYFRCEFEYVFFLKNELFERKADLSMSENVMIDFKVIRENKNAEWEVNPG